MFMTLEYYISLGVVGATVFLFTLPFILQIRREMKETLAGFKAEMREFKAETRDTNRRLDNLYSELISLRKEIR